jgi:protein gp37
MADGSAIEWTEATWNPTTGCDRLSAGCDHCYALTLAKRLKAMGAPKYQNDGDPRASGPGFGVTIHPGALRIPYRWREPRVVFVNSMSDLSVWVKCPDRAFSQVRVCACPASCPRQVSRTCPGRHLSRGRMRSAAMPVCGLARRSP